MADAGQAETLEAAARPWQLCFEADETANAAEVVYPTRHRPSFPTGCGGSWRSPARRASARAAAGLTRPSIQARTGDGAARQFVPAMPMFSFVAIPDRAGRRCASFLQVLSRETRPFADGSVGWRCTGHRFAEQSADRTSHGQPDLAAIVGVGENTERLQRRAELPAPKLLDHLPEFVAAGHEAAHPLGNAVDHLPTGRDRLPVAERDPSNRLPWHMNRRRLDRVDARLRAGGCRKLDLKQSGRSENENKSNANRRTIYAYRPPNCRACFGI